MAQRQSGRGALSAAGFTLIEVLVVIGIISVLVAMLFPAFSRVREQARRVTCASNIRQLVITQQNYADENRGWYLDMGNEDKSFNSVQNNNRQTTYFIHPGPLGVLQTKYKLSRQMFYCPSNPDWNQDRYWPDPQNQNYYVVGYSFLGGRTTLSQVKSKIVATGKFDGFEEAPANQQLFIRKAGQKTYYKEMITDLTRSLNNQINTNGGSNHLKGVTDPTGYLPTGKGGTNLGYTDGHVEWVDQKSMGQRTPSQAHRRQMYDPNGSQPVRYYW
jgi:prepilin-type N-terminal cleavage/methylation domain-containing protein/prepilin-type processing-associated H-X9-DG protein